MARRVERLTVDHIAGLPGPGSTCLAWALDPVRRARVAEADRLAEKEAWASQVLRDWGSCGRVLLADGRVAGYVFYAPAAMMPGAGVWPTAPAAADAVLMGAVYVVPDLRGGGLGRMLVQGMAKDLIKRGELRAVEAFGDRRARPDDGGDCSTGRCLPPAGFLGGVGFKTVRAHPRTPRMRMELKSAVTLREEVEQAFGRLLGVVRPQSQPGLSRPVREGPPDG